MARAPDKRIEQARAMYQNGEKLIEIARQLELPPGTVRRWKSIYGWDSERSDKNGERSQKEQNKKEKNREAAAEAVEQVLSNPDLTDKQRLFCVLYVRCFNATKAAIKAGYSKDSAMELGYQLLQKTSVRNEISRLKQNRLNREMLDEHDIFQKYMDIAFADITDFVEFGREKVPVMGAFGPVEVKDPDTGKKVPLMQEINTIRFRDSSEVDGSLISEVKQGKSGVGVKLADRMKALEWLAAHMDLATEEQRAKISLMKLKAGEAEEEELPDDGFLEALEGSAASDWEEMAGGTEHEETSSI